MFTLLDLYQTDCDVECEGCALNEQITYRTIEGFHTLPKGLTLCDLFDLINQNSRGKKK